MNAFFGRPISIETSSTLVPVSFYAFLLQLNNMDAQNTIQSTLSYCQAKLHSLTDLHEDIVSLVSGLQTHDCSNCASKINLNYFNLLIDPTRAVMEVNDERSN